MSEQLISVLRALVVGCLVGFWIVINQGVILRLAETRIGFWRALIAIIAPTVTWYAAVYLAIAGLQAVGLGISDWFGMSLLLGGYAVFAGSLISGILRLTNPQGFGRAAYVAAFLVGTAAYLTLFVASQAKSQRAEPTYDVPPDQTTPWHRPQRDF